MFYIPEKRMIKSGYFIIIREVEGYIEIISKNTRHCWIIKKIDSRKPIRLYHKHSITEMYYHKHGEFISVRKAIDEIKSHDLYCLSVCRNRDENVGGRSRYSDIC